MPAIDRKSTRLNSSHTVIYTLSLHDALPISQCGQAGEAQVGHGHEHETQQYGSLHAQTCVEHAGDRSEEHTSELQSHRDLHSFPTRRSSDLPMRPSRRSSSWTRP